MNIKKNLLLFLSFLLVVVVMVTGCTKTQQIPEPTTPSRTITSIDTKGKPFVVLNDNRPEFDEALLKLKEAEYYSPLDSLGRCGPAYAVIRKEIMPTEKRGKIGMVKPSGWQTIRYDDLIKDKYLYNRCHLIGFQLTGENANPKNLITCTRTMNAKTMLEYENQVANYIRKTHNHVLYRVTPIFKDNNMLATGVEIEAESIEDNGRGIRFNVFLYNVEDHVEINYLDGSNKLK